MTIGDFCPIGGYTEFKDFAFLGYKDTVRVNFYHYDKRGAMYISDIVLPRSLSFELFIIMYF
jgi:hypothetical protein